MGPLDPDLLIVFPGIIVFTFMCLRYYHKKNELAVRKKELEMRGSSAELGPVVEALRDDVEQLADMQEHTRAELAELQERLDFAERLLTAGRASQDEESK